MPTQQEIEDSGGELLWCGCYFDAGHDCGLYTFSGASKPPEPESDGDREDRMRDEMDFYRDEED